MSNPIKSNLPNAVTCINLLAGCMALICAFSPLDIIDGHLGYHLAFLCILLGATADFFDGLCARLLNAHSRIGAELDSLSDLITFGVAPAMIVFNLLRADATPMAIALTVLIVPLCGAIRLARFNVCDSQDSDFRGLPIPAAALFVMGVAEIFATGAISACVAITSVAACALMMVTRVKLFSLKFKSLKFSLLNLFRYTLIAGAIVFCTIWHWEGLAPTIIFYIIASLILNFSNANKAAH